MLCLLKPAANVTQQIRFFPLVDVDFKSCTFNRTFLVCFLKLCFILDCFSHSVIFGSMLFLFLDYLEVGTGQVKKGTKVVRELVGRSIWFEFWLINCNSLVRHLWNCVIGLVMLIVDNFSFLFCYFDSWYNC